MKKVLLISSCIIITYISNATSPFKIKNTEWNLLYTTQVEGNTVVGHEFEIVSLTGGYIIHKQDTCFEITSINNFGYTYYIKVKNNKVYRIQLYPQNSVYDTVIHKIYDFDMVVGDSIVVSEFPRLSKFKVTNIDFININNQQKKRWHFDNTEPWIEGIGSTKSFTNYYDFTHPISVSTTVNSVCMKQEGIEYVIDTRFLDCSTWKTNPNSLNRTDLKTEFSFLPNPNQGSFMINSKQYFFQKYSIIDLLGNEVLKGVLEEENTKIEAQLTKGIYFLRIGIENRKLVID